MNNLIKKIIWLKIPQEYYYYSKLITVKKLNSYQYFSYIRDLNS